MSKTKLIAALKADISFGIGESKRRIVEMDSEKHNPLVALMIEKNKGYIMAMEDIQDRISAFVRN